MTNQSKRMAIIVAMLMLVFGVAAVWSYSCDRPTVETRSAVCVVPWPWELVYQDGELWMKLEVK